MNTEQTTAESNTTHSTGRPSAEVPMQTPIKRKGETITTLQIMRPRTGDLRGLLLADVVNMKTDAIATLLPRITVPTLIKSEVDEMDPADLVSCGVEVVSFLVPKATMESLSV
ncbi:phage tail assembly protein [Acidovorax sp. SUPP2825]|uniref:phage tail assembly protein n=1 Tax=Acidovorax sp. SUPP2825 TaxID=2920879 RepID=UPI0023DE59C9|nr:phage tail assembly protein [Acidovorax sp. SUPP2825]GKS93223.1 phage tail assembly protein [Acidovorax sp. SUPP2825]